MSQSPSPSPHCESGEQQESSPRQAGDGVVDVSRLRVVEAPGLGVVEVSVGRKGAMVVPKEVPEDGT